jgi:hypothetical protein
VKTGATFARVRPGPRIARKRVTKLCTAPPIHRAIIEYQRGVWIRELFRFVLAALFGVLPARKLPALGAQPGSVRASARNASS